jgi:hypothetical protein
MKPFPAGAVKLVSAGINLAVTRREPAVAWLNSFWPTVTIWTPLTSISKCIELPVGNSIFIAPGLDAQDQLGDPFEYFLDSSHQSSLEIVEYQISCWTS